MKRAMVVAAVLVLGASVIGVGSPAGAATPTLGPVRTVGAGRPDGVVVAFDGTNHLVVWTTGPAGTDDVDVRGARIAPNGSVLDPGGFPIVATAKAQFAPKVSFDGTSFVVVWQNSGPSPTRIEATRVSRQGKVLDSPPLRLGTGTNPYVASSDAVSLVVWTELDLDSGSSDVGYNVRSARIFPDGRVRDAPGHAVAQSRSLDTSFHAFGIASDGDDFMVLYGKFGDDPAQTGGRSVLAKVSGDNQPGASAFLAFHDLGGSIASNGTDYLVAGSYCVEPGDPSLACHDGGNEDIFTVRVTPDLVQRLGAGAGTGPPDQTFPQVAWNGGHYLVAYRRQALERPDGGPPTRVGPVDIRAALLSSNGATNVEGGFVVAADVFGTSAVAPGRSGGFGVAFSDQTASNIVIRFRTVTPSPK